MQNTIEEKICVKGQMDSLKIVFVLDFKNNYLHILSKFVNNLFTQEIGGVVLPGAEPNPVQKAQNQVSTIVARSIFSLYNVKQKQTKSGFSKFYKHFGDTFLKF